MRVRCPADGEHRGHDQWVAVARDSADTIAQAVAAASQHKLPNQSFKAHERYLSVAGSHCAVFRLGSPAFGASAPPLTDAAPELISVLKLESPDAGPIPGVTVGTPTVHKPPPAWPPSVEGGMTVAFIAWLLLVFVVDLRYCVECVASVERPR